MSRVTEVINRISGKVELWIILVISSLFFSIASPIPYLRAIFGFVALILIPGFLVVEKLLSGESFVQKLGLAMIIGMSLQLLIIASIYIAGSLIYFSGFNFQVIVVLINVIITSVLLLLKSNQRLRNLTARCKLSSLIKRILTRENIFLLTTFLISVSIRLCFQELISTGYGGYASADTGLFLDVGRALNNGEFVPKGIQPALTPRISYFSGKGYWFISHPMVSFAYALFFLLGGVNIEMAKVMNVFAGSLMIFSLYGTAKEILNKRIATLTVAIAAINPWLISFSSIIDGRELLGTFFLLTTLYFVLLALKERSPYIAAVSGVLLFITLYVTDYIFFAFFVSISMIFLLFNFRKGFRYMMSGMLLLFTFYMIVRKLVSAFINPTPVWVWAVMLGFPFVTVYMYKKFKDDNWLNTLNLTFVFAAVFIFLFSLTNLKIFLYPSLVKLEPLPLLYQAQQANPYLTFEYLFFFKSVFLEGLTEKFAVFIKMELFVWSSAQVLLALLALLTEYKWKQKILIFVYPLCLTLLAVWGGSQEFYPPRFPIPSPLFLPIDAGYISRIINMAGQKIPFSATPFIIIASAVAVESIAKKFESISISLIVAFKEVKKGVLRLNLGILTMVTILILLVVQYIPYYYYFQVQNSVPNDHNRWQMFYQIHLPAYTWIEQNTNEDTIIMANTYCVVAWDINRWTVALNIGDPINGGYVGNFTTFQEFVKSYHVNYIIVDGTAYEPIRQHLIDPLKAPSGYHLVFWYQRPDGIYVMIYNVTDVWTTG
jgi:hypothetical protein